MVCLSDFIVANAIDADAILLAKGEHGETWPVFETKNLTPEDLAPLYFLLSDQNAFAPPLSSEVAPDYDRPFENALEEFSAFLLLADDGQGKVVLEIPLQLTQELAGLTATDLPEIAWNWSNFKSLSMNFQTFYDVKETQVILEKLQKIARLAVDRKSSLLLWICL